MTQYSVFTYIIVNDTIQRIYIYNSKLNKRYDTGRYTEIFIIQEEIYILFSSIRASDTFFYGILKYYQPNYKYNRTKAQNKGSDLICTSFQYYFHIKQTQPSATMSKNNPFNVTTTDEGSKINQNK